MLQTNTPDSQSLRLYLILAILGAILSVAGWYRMIF
jgi:hypothetical protein